MKRVTIYLGLILLASLFLQVYAGMQPDEELFYEARILFLDMKWKKAQKKLDELLEKYPNSRWFSQALYWKAKCLQEQEGKELEALDTYKSYAKRNDRTKILIEEAELAIIDLASKLYNKGKRSYLKEIEKRLSHSNRVIEYYAAFELSYMKDKKVAVRAVPVLKRILESESDDRLRDKAKIALLRIDPGALKDFEEKRYERKIAVLKIRIYKKGQTKPEVKINIPWALADLALRAISEENVVLMKEEGYDLNRIRKELLEFRGEILRFEDKDTIIEIWID
ncbi:MAG: tetratricopeptide repeat protein [Candidatus Aminicenantes bacterium]|nr:tetratricopeptide repeat protein [Candidatus Aminicenantes bacterium]